MEWDGEGKREAPRVRVGCDQDSAGVIDVISRVFQEYPGCVLDVDREEPELRAPARSFDGFWVVEQGSRICGCVACVMRDEVNGPYVELKKMYIERGSRGFGLGRVLVERVEAWARERGVLRMELWSDTRFELAHAVYSHLGYRRSGRARELGDLSNTTEYHFHRTLEP